MIGRRKKYDFSLNLLFREKSLTSTKDVNINKMPFDESECKGDKF